MTVRTTSKRLLAALGAGAVLASGGLFASTSIASEGDASGAPAARAASGEASSDETSPPAPRPAGAVDWQPCEGQNLAGLECGTVEVPLDYDQPDGKTIEIAVSRLASTNPDERRGVLLLNPGGPGGSGLSMPLMLAQAGMPANVLESYDLIGFDPRGIGRSAPVTCDWNQQDMFTVLPSHAEGPEDVTAKMQAVRAATQKCADADNNGVLPHVTTANTARDMDVIREALGEEEVSYLGYSYGSYLGAVYDQLFPERTDRVVLDSVVGPDMVWRKEFRLFGLGAELRFPDFASWAAKRDATYELGDSKKEVRRTYQRLAEQLDEQPVQGLNGTLFRWAVFDALYADSSFPTLAQLIQALDAADAAAVEAARAKLSPEPAQQQEEVPADNARAAQLAVLCNDAAWPDTVEHYQKAVHVDSKRFPLVGSVMGNMWGCASWPIGQQDKPVEIDDSSDSDVLLLQNVRDPATTIPGALDMRKAMGDRSRLVTVNEGGHGVYVLDTNACATNIATHYLLDGELPEDDRFCGANKEGKVAPLKKSEQREHALQELRSQQGFL